VAEISHGELSCMLGRHSAEGFNKGVLKERARIKAIISMLVEENKSFQETIYRKGREDALEKLLSEVNKKVIYKDIL